MANHSDVGARDHKGLIYTITGGILAAGILMMAFYNIGPDRARVPITQKPVVTTQK